MYRNRVNSLTSLSKVYYLKEFLSTHDKIQFWFRYNVALYQLFLYLSLISFMMSEKHAKFLNSIDSQLINRPHQRKYFCNQSTFLINMYSQCYDENSWYLLEYRNYDPKNKYFSHWWVITRAKLIWNSVSCSTNLLDTKRELKIFWHSLQYW